MSLINLQGKLNCKYVVGFYFSHKPQRATLRERWPPSVEENLVRLEDAGLPYDRQIPKCSNCGGKQKQSRPRPWLPKGTINREREQANSGREKSKKWDMSPAAARKSEP